MTKTVKIIIAVVVVVIVIAIVWALSKSGNDFASSETMKLIKDGTRGKWNNGNSPDWTAYIAKSKALFGEGENWGIDGGANQAKASGWIKGMDIARSAANLETFKVDIQKYVDEKTSKPDWEITVGELLK